jgi:integrase
LRWLGNRDVEARTAERTLSLMRTHVLPKWGSWSVAKIDYMAIQDWVTELARTLAPATVAKCHGLLLMVLRTAVRARIIAANPAEGVKVPGGRNVRPQLVMISRNDFFGRLLPAIPEEHRALVCVAAGAGLRWGECAGLAWGAVDLDRARLRVVQVAVETPAEVVIRPYPKTRAGVRTVPLPPFLVDALRSHRGEDDPEHEALVFDSRVNGPLRRSNFRRRIWLPSLIRAGLLGTLVQVDRDRFDATWRDRNGVQHTVRVRHRARRRRTPGGQRGRRAPVP